MRIPPHDPDLIGPTDGWENYSWTNGDRADSARQAIEYFGQQREMDTDEETLSIDLLTDILYFLFWGPLLKSLNRQWTRA